MGCSGRVVTRFREISIIYRAHRRLVCSMGPIRFSAEGSQKACITSERDHAGLHSLLVLTELTICLTSIGGDRRDSACLSTGRVLQ